ncbi:hypothetical protein [Runella sp.]|uniref:hypothetical protein n=1 Tax=Runella sp. TaxID=1960881 RepID=UPI003D122952
MTLEEVARLRLEILGDESADTIDGLQKGLKEINSEMRLLELNGEKGSETWKEMKRLQKDVNEEIKEMTRNIDLNDASMNELTARSRQLNRELGNLTVGSEEWIDKLKQISEVDEKIDGTREAMKRIKGEGEEQTDFWTSFKANFSAAFTVDAITGAIGSVIDFGREIFETAGKFERYEAVLKNALGTQEAATKVMDNIKQLAASTPFTVDELTESYVKYVNRGLQPTMAEMTKMGDIAASQGKSFDQLTEAILDATTGEFERLKEFGIQASKNGEEVELSFKGVQKTIANTPEAIKETLLSFGELEGVMGGMVAISGTLEGKASNLGDNFDALKIILGDVLKPVFLGVMDAMNAGIEIVKQVVENSEPVVTVFDNISKIAGSLWQSIRSLIGQFIDLNSTSFTVRDVMSAIGLAFNGLTTPMRAAIATVQMIIDAYGALMTKGKELLNFFGADFKIDPKATFDNMLSNADKNFKAIGTSWTKNVADVQINKIKDVQDKAIASENAKYAAEKARIDKTFKDASAKAAEFAKLETNHTAAVNKAKADALKAEALARQNYIKETVKDETERDKQLKANALQLRTELRDLDKKSNDEVVKHKSTNQTKVSAEAQKAAKKDAEEREKSEAAANKAIEDGRVSLIKNDLERALAAEELKYKREVQRINETKIAETLKKQQLEVLEETHQAKIDKLKDDAAKKEEAAARKKETDEAAARDKKRKEDQLLLDAGFKAEIENAKLTLSLTTNNAQAQYDAKLKLLEAEARYREQKLKNEAEAEKKRIAESIKDTDDRATAIKAIDATLTAQLQQNETKLQADKVKLQEEATAKRKKDNEEFLSWMKKAQDGDFAGFQKYLSEKVKEEQTANKDREKDSVRLSDAVRAIMKGDFTLFTQYLAQKTKNDTVFNSERFQDFSKTTQSIGQVAQAGVAALQKLNQAYLEKQQSNIKKEKDTQLAAWEEKYKKGLISKDEYEKGVTNINKNADDKLKAAQKEAFERDKKLQIAMALIAGGMAFVKALASGFFPVNLVFAAATAVATGLQVAAIKRQQFSGENGGVFQAANGYVRNAGVPQGPRHGLKYGDSGISLIDRSSGNEIGEMEGGEPFMILSRNTYKNNRPVIDRLLHSSLHKNGAPITLRDGGIISVAQTPFMFRNGGRMFMDGGMDDGSGGSGEYQESNSDSGSGGYDSGSSGDVEGVPDQNDTKAMIAENTQMQKDMLEELRKTNGKLSMLLVATGQNGSELRNHSGLLNDIKNKPTGPSLHEIQGAFSSAAAAIAKSNL